MDGCTYCGLRINLDMALESKRPLSWYTRLHCGLVVQKHRLELALKGVQPSIRELHHQLELLLRLRLIFFAMIKCIRYSTRSCTHIEGIVYGVVIFRNDWCRAGSETDGRFLCPSPRYAALYQITYCYGLVPDCGFQWGVVQISRLTIFSWKTSFTNRLIIAGIKGVRLIQFTQQHSKTIKEAS